MGQVTISGTTYDVYGDEAGFKTYMAGKLDSANYDDADNSSRKKAMVSAARWIDRESWDGTLTDPTTPQPLAFPRIGLRDCDGTAVDSASVPVNVDEASYELAYILLGDASAADAGNTGGNIKKAEAGSAKVTFFRPGAADGSGSGGSAFPPIAQKLLRCFLGGGGAGIAGPEITGTKASGFTACDDELTEGYA